MNHIPVLVTLSHYFETRQREGRVRGSNIDGPAFTLRASGIYSILSGCCVMVRERVYV